jgi:hypothetical protein
MGPRFRRDDGSCGVVFHAMNCHGFKFQTAKPSLRAQAKQSMRQQGSKSGLLRRFTPRNDVKIHHRILATRPSCAGIIRLLNSEGAGNAGRSMRPQPCVRNKKAHKHSHHGHTGITRHSPRNGFNGCFVLSPVTGLVCHRRLRNCFRKLDASVGASGPHDFAVRRHAPSSEAPPASTASRPAFVTIASRPSKGTGPNRYNAASTWPSSEISEIQKLTIKVPSFRDGALAPSPESRDSPSAIAHRSSMLRIAPE